MPEANDHELLAQFARTNSETAFAALVGRHVNLVYAVALRRVGNPHAAEEITQAVFIILARKGKNLSAKTILPGWLHQTARLTAANYLRAEIRRRKHEQEAFMQTTLTESENPANDEIWRQLAPHLDEAISRLRAADRDALILRYFENKNLREVGAALGVEERAAQKRVNRAVEKLRHYFSKRGIGLTTAIIAGAVSANSVHAAPIGLVQAVSVVAISKGAAAGGSTLILVKGTLKFMAWTKAKTAIVASVIALLVGGMTTTITVSHIENSPRKIAEETQAAYAALASYSDTCIGTASGGDSKTQTSCTIKLQRPKQYRVEWTQTSGGPETKGIVWSDGNANYLVSGKAENFSSASPQKANDTEQAFAFAGALSGTSASIIPCAFFNLNYGNTLAVFPSKNSDTRRMADEKIDGVDCFVLVKVLDLAKIFAKAKPPKPSSLKIENRNTGTITTTIWIGKKDHLIRQIRSVTAGSSRIVKWTDDMLKRRLQSLNKPVTPENLAALRVEMEQAQERANETGFVFTEKHQNIVVNPKFSAADFAP